MKLEPHKPCYLLPPHDELVAVFVRHPNKEAQYLVSRLDHDRLLGHYADQPTTLAGRPIFYSYYAGSIYLFPPPDDEYDLAVRLVPQVQEV